ncbi:MAG TPA: hypothetical protein VGJ16_10500 [Pirellulales bacterium]
MSHARSSPAATARGHGGLIPVAERDEGEAGEPLDVQLLWSTVRYWWKLALPAAVLLALGAATTIAFLSQPRYTASAWLIIREKPEYLLNPQVMDDPRRFVQNQMELMRSPPVIDPVASKPEVFATPELSSHGDASERLRRLLKIRAMGQSDFFVIEFTSQEPKKAAIVANEVAKAYLLLQDRDLSRRMEATITRLEKQRAEQQQLIERLRDQVQEKTRALTGVDPFATKAVARQSDEGRETLHLLQTQIIAAEIEQALTAARVEAEEEVLKKQVVEVSANEVENRVRAHSEIMSLRKRIGDAHALIKGHEQTSTNLARNTTYQHLVRQKANDEQQFEKRLVELRTSIKTEMEEESRLKRGDEVSGMRQNLDAKKLAVNILRERIEKERAAQQVYKGETVELEFLRADYDSAAHVFEAINSRIVAMRLEQHAPDRVLLFKEATPPAYPDEALPYKKMGMLASAAFVLPFGLAVLYELCHRRVASRRQLESTLRSPVVAEVTAMPRRIATGVAAASDAANI